MYKAKDKGDQGGQKQQGGRRLGHEREAEADAGTKRPREGRVLVPAHEQEEGHEREQREEAVVGHVAGERHEEGHERPGAEAQRQGAALEAGLPQHEVADIGRTDRVGQREPLQALRRLRVREAEGAPRADPGGPEVVGERRVVEGPERGGVHVEQAQAIVGEPEDVGHVPGRRVEGPGIVLHIGIGSGHDEVQAQEHGDTKCDGADPRVSARSCPEAIRDADRDDERQRTDARRHKIGHPTRPAQAHKPPKHKHDDADLRPRKQAGPARRPCWSRVPGLSRHESSHKGSDRPGAPGNNVYGGFELFAKNPCLELLLS